MAKHRFINTKFWSDSWIRKINPLDRYLFLYFLTNEHTNIAGIYELSLENMAFETGIEEDTLSKSMLKKLEPKIFYIKGWVCISNFERHQQGRGSPKIITGIKHAKSEIPVDIIEEFEKLKNKKRYTIHTVRGGTNYSDLDSDSDISIYHSDRSHGKEVNEIIGLFKDINLTAYKGWYKNKTQRQAISDLLKEIGVQKLKAAISVLPQTNEMKYAPSITTPLQLKEKLTQLRNFIIKEKKNSKWNVI